MYKLKLKKWLQPFFFSKKIEFKKQKDVLGLSSKTIDSVVKIWI